MSRSGQISQQRTASEAVRSGVLNFSEHMY
jgi:hypothetical protein